MLIRRENSYSPNSAFVFEWDDSAELKWICEKDASHFWWMCPCHWCDDMIKMVSVINDYNLQKKKNVPNVHIIVEWPKSAKHSSPSTTTKMSVAKSCRPLDKQLSPRRSCNYAPLSQHKQQFSCDTISLIDTERLSDMPSRWPRWPWPLERSRHMEAKDCG